MDEQCLSAPKTHWVERFRQYLQGGQRATVRLVETHISWVLVGDTFAYKIKKPVNFGFLDFSQLEQRRRCCEAEITLNRRLAPAIYLQAVPIYGSPDWPTLSVTGTDSPFEYAVKMKSFDPDALLTPWLGQEQTSTAVDRVISALAVLIADFHQRAARAELASDYGSETAVWLPVAENFLQIEPLLSAQDDLDQLAQLEVFSRASHQRLSGLLVERKNQGFIRACHGDLHSGNIAIIDAQPVPFDCIEFNDSLRFIDVASDVAFLLMDLFYQQKPKLANRFLNVYLERSGDYAQLPLLRFYQVYRALVRAKVGILRLQQIEPANASAVENILVDYRQHIGLARTFAQPRRPSLIIMHGLSGSGKSTLAERICAHNGAVHLRSDVERKRLFGLTSLQSSANLSTGSIYTSGATEQTFTRLLQLADGALHAGFAVVVDATFLHVCARRPFMRLAEQLGVAFAIVSCRVDEQQLLVRLRQRAQRGDDASEADVDVMRAQRRQQEPFTEAEQACVIALEQQDSVLAGEPLPQVITAFLTESVSPISEQGASDEPIG